MMVDQATARREADEGPAERQGSGPRFRADIQGLRAVAVTVVVLFHAGLTGFSGGFVGVDVFFVISGFVITGMLAAGRRRTGRIALGTFYLRRIRRLLPALAVLLVVVLALDPLLGPRSAGATTATAAAAALFVANIQLALSSPGYFDPSAESNPLLHLWTLSVEEQVYLVLPLLLVGAWRLSRDRWSWTRVSGVTLGTAAVASFALAVVLAGWNPQLGDLPGRLAFYSAPTRAWEFLVGAVLALVAPVVGRRARSWCAVVGALGLAAAVVTFDAATAFPGIAAGVPVVATVLLLVAGSGEGGPLSAALSARPAGWLGDRSYSWYLWHWPLIVFAGATFPGVSWAPLAAAALSLLPACLSYSLVEQPIRRARAPRPRATIGLGLACVLVPLALTRAVAPVPAWVDSADAMDQIGEAVRPHADLTARCNDSLPDTASREDCTWRVADPKGRILLIGDSNAGQFSEPFTDGANALGLDATIQTRAACPFADLVVRRGGAVDERCRAFYERQMAAIEEDPPDVVVIAAAVDLLVDNEQVALAETALGSEPQGDEDQISIYEEALERTLARLDEVGAGVVVIHPVPRFTGWPGPAGCSRARVIVDVDGCSAERALSVPGPVAQAEERAVASSPGTVGLELGPALCPDERCLTQRAGESVWKDESHVSVDGALSIRPQLEAAMDRAWSATAGAGP